ncbi:MAG: PKD domain-containing protein [Bacteroidales bacterium]|nr:PKD domain-containing protein [Bacteroidales bacterium]
MKNSFSKWGTRFFLMIGVISLITFVSCKDDEEDPPANPIASFQYVISTTNFLEVTFTNYSQNATSYSWNFGDGQTSVEANPVHAFTAAGTYTVVLTAKNSANASATFNQTIEIKDPNSALALLAGETSKTWKLFREGTCMGVGPDAASARLWWSLSNTGARPCYYFQEYTFKRDGSYVFDDHGSFWGEGAVFAGTAVNESCFEAIASNMVNSAGADVSAWLSGTHAFTYDPATNTITLTGTGAWLGLPQLGTAAESIVPEASKSFKAVIEEKDGYDLMTVSYTYAALYWDFTYVSYSNPALEPEVIQITPPYGEDLPNLTPAEMWNTFETATSFVVLDTAGVYPGNGTAANGGMAFTIGVADPAGVGVNCGKYDRKGTYQELQFQMENDIQFNNFTTVSVDVYMPSSNNYSGTLTKGIAVIIGEASQTEQWWTGHLQYDATATVMDAWVTYTFNLNAPTSGPGMGVYTPGERTDLDFFAISLGGGGHADEGTFYIRNFRFN